MDTSLSSAQEISDQLLLAGNVLHALECGRMMMHAQDYREISAWASEELGKLETVSLRFRRRSLPGALQNVVENLIQERGEMAWTTDALMHPPASDAYAALLKRLRAQ